MSDMIAWIAAEAERPGAEKPAGIPRRRGGRGVAREESAGGLPAPEFPEQQFVSRQFPAHEFPEHQFPARRARSAEENREPFPPFAKNAKDGAASTCVPTSTSKSPLPAKDAGNGAPCAPLYEAQVELVPAADEADPVRDEVRERELRTYRRRTVAMLRRYMRFSIETGRLPSLLGKEFFRAKVTAYTLVTFEDRVIFVHDMEKCLERLDEFSRQLIARHILQEHDQAATGRLLQCAERTVRTFVPIALERLSNILLEAGLMEPIESIRENSCQGGEND